MPGKTFIHTKSHPLRVAFLLLDCSSMHAGHVVVGGGLAVWLPGVLACQQQKVCLHGFTQVDVALLACW
jgi:hypothetical protein